MPPIANGAADDKPLVGYEMGVTANYYYADEDRLKDMAFAAYTIGLFLGLSATVGCIAGLFIPSLFISTLKFGLDREVVSVTIWVVSWCFLLRAMIFVTSRSVRALFLITYTGDNVQFLNAAIQTLETRVSLGAMAGVTIGWCVFNMVFYSLYHQDLMLSVANMMLMIFFYACFACGVSMDKPSFMMHKDEFGHWV